MADDTDVLRVVTVLSTKSREGTRRYYDNQVNELPPWHTTPTSSEWSQSWVPNPGKVHAASDDNLINEYYLHGRRHRRPPSDHGPEYQNKGRYTPPATTIKLMNIISMAHETDVLWVVTVLSTKIQGRYTPPVITIKLMNNLHGRRHRRPPSDHNPEYQIQGR